MSSIDAWILPDGIEELHQSEAVRLEFIRREVLDLFSSWGYRLVTPPLIEFIEPLLSGSGSELDLKTFKFVDQSSGRMLGIRADITPQVARIDARTQNSNLPARLCYVGTVLHTFSDNLSRCREPLQVGAELYGHAGIHSDVEVIKLMLAMLKVAGLGDIHLDIGHVGVFRGLVDQANLHVQQEKELFEILQRKATPELENFLFENVEDDAVAEMIGLLPELNGDFGILQVAKESLANAPSEVLAALASIVEISQSLREVLPSLSIHFDLAELRGYHYQTGIVFAAFTPGFGKEVARGGRYDEIGKVFGQARPATGFSADLKLISKLSWDDQKIRQEIIFSPVCDDQQLKELVDHLRKSGKIVINDLPGHSLTPKELGCSHEMSRVGDAWIVMPLA